MKVVVAPLFSDWPAFDTPFDGVGLDAAWDDRPRSELEVPDAETLGDTLVRAAEELGVTVAADSEGRQTLRELLTFYSFHFEDDRTAVRAGYGYGLTIVREDGLAYWNQDFKEATWGDIRRAKDAGLLGDRDIQRLYLVLVTPAGNGSLLDWSTLFGTYAVLRFVLATAADAEGAIQFAKRLFTRFERAEEAITSTGLDLAARGALPDNLAGSLGDGPWHAADLAGLLGVGEERAQGLLEGFGFGLDTAGLWRLRSDPEAEFFYTMRQEAEIAHTGMHAAQPDVALKDRLSQYVTTGERPQVPEHFDIVPFSERSEDEALEESKRIDAQYQRDDAAEEEGLITEGEGGDLADLLGSEAIPYETVVLKCGCADPDCRARLEFMREGEKLRLLPEQVRDHFVANSVFLSLLAMSAAEDADAQGEGSG